MVVAETAETKTMVSPLRTVTAPSASFASLPVSMVMGWAPMCAVTLWILIAFAEWHPDTAFQKGSYGPPWSVLILILLLILIPWRGPRRGVRGIKIKIKD